MVAAVRHPAIAKRFLSDTFAPPSGFHSDARGPDVTAEEILVGGVRESDWSFPVLISTPSREDDRGGDGVIAEGCHYAGFAASPVIYFEHQEIKFGVGKMRGPDGRLYFCIVPGKGILGRIWIRQPQPDDPKDYAELCKTIWILVRDELLNGISAGFDPVGHVKANRSGGMDYREWELLEVSLVNIAMNRRCRVIREPFSWDDAILKRFSPSVIKGLKTMTASAVHKSPTGNTKDIKKRGDKWVILDNKTRKELSSHATREEAVAAMRALQYHKHEGKSAEPEAQKGMAESSGAAGGYTVPEEHKAMYGEIAKRMEDHKINGADSGDGPVEGHHEAYFHPETGDLRHVHNEGATEEHVKGVAADLHDIPGVKSLTQSAEAPKDGEGYHKVYPVKVKDMADGDSGGDSGGGGAEVEEGHGCAVMKGSRYARLGKVAFGLVQKRRLKGWGIEQAVRRIKPRLEKSGMPAKQAITRAWYVAALQKGWLPIVEKAAEDYSEPDEDDAPDTAEDAVDDATTDAAMEAEATGADELQPRSLELCQAAIENLEAALPGLEPQDREFFTGIVEQIRKWGSEKHPDEDFGGEDDAGAEAAATGEDSDTRQQKVTDEMLARYKSYRPMKVKRISVVKVLKSLQKDPMVADSIRKAANHLHAIGDMHAEFDDKKGHCILKGYTEGDHRGCRKMARELDRVHGAITRGEEKPVAKPTEDGTAHGEDEFDANEIGPIMKSLCDREEAIGKSQKEIGDTLFRVTGKRRTA